MYRLLLALPQFGTEYAEIKVRSVKKPELSKVMFSLINPGVGQTITKQNASPTARLYESPSDETKPRSSVCQYTHAKRSHYYS